MNKKIRFAVIGCGHIGKRHAEMITRDEGAELVALCDIRPKEELGIEAYAVPFARNIDELFRLGLDIDVVNICTPNGLHAEMAIHFIFPPLWRSGERRLELLPWGLLCTEHCLRL